MSNDVTKRVHDLIAEYGEESVLNAICVIKEEKLNQLTDKAKELLKFISECGYEYETVVIDNERITIWNGVRSETITF